MNSSRPGTKLKLASLSLAAAAALAIACTSAQHSDGTQSTNGLKPVTAAASYADLRSYQHGIDLLKRPSSGDYLAIFSSDGLPPANGDTGSWNHDIYFSSVSATSPTLGATTGTKWLSATEAQEPSSSAINASGTKICTTWEDGNLSTAGCSGSPSSPSHG
jgi:hypothetical protein